MEFYTQPLLAYCTIICVAVFFFFFSWHIGALPYSSDIWLVGGSWVQYRGFSFCGISGSCLASGRVDTTPFGRRRSGAEVLIVCSKYRGFAHRRVSELAGRLSWQVLSWQVLLLGIRLHLFMPSFIFGCALLFTCVSYAALLGTHGACGNGFSDCC